MKGTFNGLPQDAIVAIGGVQFRISYVGGDGDDVVLTQIPQATAFSTIWTNALGGDWNVGMWITDNAHPAAQAHWMGPDIYRQLTDDGLNASPDDHPFPNGRGRISVIGAKDSTAAQVTSAQVTPTQVDTLPGSATVHIKVNATDAPGEKVTEVSAGLGRGTWSPGDIDLPAAELQLTSGTRVDGIWEGDITLPQGVPPDSGVLPRPGSPYVSRIEQCVERCRRIWEQKTLPSTKSLRTMRGIP